jgi:hypothetical protein
VVATDGAVVIPTTDGWIARIEPRPGGTFEEVRVSDRAGLGPLAPGGAGEIYAGTTDGLLLRVGANGAITWSVPLGARVERSPILTEQGTIITAAGSMLFGVAPNGSLLWRKAIEGPIIGGPLSADDGTIFIAVTSAKRGALIGLDATGAPNLRIELPAKPTPSLTLVDHRLWVGLTDATVRSYRVTAAGLANSPWPKARGGKGNAGRAFAVSP